MSFVLYPLSTTWRTSGGAVPSSASGQHRARHAGGRLWPRTARRQGVRGGQGRAEKPRRGCEVAGRSQAGGASTTCVQGHCARARVGGARTFRLDLGLLARRQREDEVDTGGLEVRGRGECPGPAAGYPSGGWAELASASSPAAAFRVAPPSAICQLPAVVSAVQLVPEKACSAPTPPLLYGCRKHSHMILDSVHSTGDYTVKVI